jgi:CO/xanthine dehydrogenase FAD-binding subunit
VNASPAADSLPALMVYEAELLLASARGTRRVPYVEFHTGYKQTKLAVDEIIRAIALQPRFSGYRAYSRKVGTRNAQAIAKLCLAALGKISGNKIEDARLAIGSMAVTPVRLRRTEQVLVGQPFSAALMSEARQAMEAEVAPIDDIRSSALYRLHVAGNLLQEFLEGLFA